MAAKIPSSDEFTLMGTSRGSTVKLRKDFVIITKSRSGITLRDNPKVLDKAKWLRGVINWGSKTYNIKVSFDTAASDLICLIRPNGEPVHNLEYEKLFGLGGHCSGWSPNITVAVVKV